MKKERVHERTEQNAEKSEVRIESLAEENVGKL